MKCICQVLKINSLNRKKISFFLSRVSDIPQWLFWTIIGAAVLVLLISIWIGLVCCYVEKKDREPSSYLPTYTNWKKMMEKREANNNGGEAKPDGNAYF